MEWEVEFTDEFHDWWKTLGESEKAKVAAAVELLEQEGPSLPRPMVDTVKGSRHSHMKELRPRGGNIRVLFAFDPRRTAILLIGGDKTHRWQTWYRAFIPVADDLYDAHLQILEQEKKGAGNGSEVR